MTPASPLYSKIHQTPPAWLNLLGLNAIPEIQRVLDTDASGQVQSAQGITQFSTALSWMVGFSALLATTIQELDESSFRNNSAQVLSLSSMVFSAIHTGTLYWHHQR